MLRNAQLMVGPGIYKALSNLLLGHHLYFSEQIYRIAGNIGGEFNLADWRICERTAKLNSAKRHAVLLVPRHMVSDRQIKFRQTAKITNPPNITPANFSGYTVRIPNGIYILVTLNAVKERDVMHVSEY